MPGGEHRTSRVLLLLCLLMSAGCAGLLTESSSAPYVSDSEKSADVIVAESVNPLDMLSGLFEAPDVQDEEIPAAEADPVVTQDGDTSNDCCYATYNLHSACKGVYESIEFSSEIEPYILKKVIYKKPGDKVNFFANAANAIGIVFMKFPGKEKMLEMMDHMNRYIQIKLKD